MLSFFKRNTTAEGEKGNKRRLFLLIGAALLGIFLLLLGGGAFGTTDSKEASEADRSAEEELLDYRNDLESRIRILCESVRGVEDVRVILTLDGGYESVYATEERDGDLRYVIVGSGASAEGLLLSCAAPTVAGVGVVCAGGDDPTVRRELTALLAATLRIPSNRIYITGSK